MSLQERLNKFIKEVGVPITRIGREVDLSATSIYHWLSGDRILSAKSVEKIEKYLQRFDY